MFREQEEAQEVEAENQQNKRERAIVNIHDQLFRNRGEIVLKIIEKKTYLWDAGKIFTNKNKILLF